MGGGDVARNRKAQPGAAKAPGGGGIDLMEGFENALKLIFGDADAGIRHAEFHHLPRMRQVSEMVPSSENFVALLSRLINTC